jgi:hypothetical protein
MPNPPRRPAPAIREAELATVHAILKKWLRRVDRQIAKLTKQARDRNQGIRMVPPPRLASIREIEASKVLEVISPSQILDRIAGL